MKNIYGKTHHNTWFSALGEKLLLRLEELSYAADSFKRRPCLIPAAMLILCCVLCYRFESFVPAVVMAVTTLGACLFFSSRRPQNNVFSAGKNGRHMLLLAGFLLSLIIVYNGMYIHSRLSACLTPQNGAFSCTVTEVSYDLAGGMDMTVRLEGGVYAKAAFYKEIPQNIRAGDEVVLHGKLKEPESAGNPGEFDYKRYLKKKGILYVISCDSYELVGRASFPQNVTGLLRKFFFELRKGAVGAVSGTFSEEERALAAAVCTGDRSLISDGTKRDFKLSCCSHLLAVSGTHFAGFLAGLPMILDTLKVKRKKAFFIYVIFALLIGCLTGWSDSVTRAAIMSICIFAMRDWVSALSVASLVMVTADPFCAMSSGFRMSFCAVIAIKMYSDKISRVLKKLHSGDFLAGIISPTIAASLGMIPFWEDISMKIDLEHLGIQTAGSFIAQTACAFFVPCVVLCLLMPFGAQFLSSPLCLCLNVLQKLVSFGGSITERNISAIHLSQAFLAVTAVVVFLLLIPPSILKRIFLKPAALLLAVMTGFEVFSILDRPSAKVVFADVGQGDCCLIMTEDLTCLIDAGTYDEGAETVCNLLDYYGIYQVDICVMSHWDVDHAGGIAALYDLGRTKQIITSYVPGPGAEDKDVREFFEAVGFDDGKRSGYLSSIDSVCSGDLIFLSETVYLDILYPASGTGGGNEESLVAMLHIEGEESACILFTGDIGIKTEEKILKSGMDIDCDILKVAHHGSKYSSSEEFIEACSPEAAVISVGKNNFYGHPTPETLERLNSYGCEVFRTDREGAVILNY